MKRVLNINGEGNNNNKILNSTEVVVGYGVNNEPITVDFSKCEHLIMTGATGSGKSRSLEAIITDLSEKNSFEDLEIYMMQFVKQDCKKFEDLEYCRECLYPVDDESRYKTLEKMTSTVEHLERKAKRRKSLIENFITETGYKDSNRISSSLPLVLLVIDEFSSITNSILNYDESMLREALLESLKEIINICKGLNMSVIQIKSRLNILDEETEIESVSKGRKY